MAIEKDREIKIENRTDAKITMINPGYTTRRFERNETKVDITYEELKNFNNTPGGNAMLREYFIIHDEEVYYELMLEKPEPEYWYTAKTIKYLLEKGSLDQLEDTLNFCPQGVKDLIIRIAVDLKISDSNKREMITRMTGYNIDAQIKNKKLIEEEDEKPKKRTTRKSTPVTEEKKTTSTRGRRKTSNLVEEAEKAEAEEDK